MNEDTDTPLVYDNILTDGPELHLQGGYCSSCDSYHFPAQEKCSECLGEVEYVDIGKSGNIYSVTTIRTRAPLGLPSPYSVAYVDLDEVPLRIFSLMAPNEAGQYHIGQAVELHVAPIGRNNNNEICIRPYFHSLSNPLNK